MQADLYKEDLLNPKFDNIPNNKSISLLLDFIEKNVELVTKLYSNTNLNEKQLNQELEIIFNNISSNLGLPYTFKGNYIDIYTPNSNKKREVDLAVIYNEQSINTKAFSVFEMKRLPTPSPKSREKEYLIGDLGGVERFKKNLHGKSFNKVGIIAYIQKEDFNYWFAKINSWIIGLSKFNMDKSIIWNKTEVLENINTKEKTARYKSLNLRKTSTFTIYHIWMDLK